MTLDLRDWLARVEAAIGAHRLEPGRYARWRGEAGDAVSANPYGCADAANLRYTLGLPPEGPDPREACVRTLQAMQSPETGLFEEASHHPIHTTAHCIGALELFEARPRHALAALRAFEAPDAAARFLEGLDWPSEPWTESHRGAGLYAALVGVGAATPAWEEAYFTWLEDEIDPGSGLWRRGAVPVRPWQGPAVFPHLAGTFHYLFNFEHAKRPPPCPERLVDTCLEIEARRLFPLCHYVGFADVDWVYCLHRASRVTEHRRAEVRAALDGFAERYVVFLRSVDLDGDANACDLHALFGSVSALAELQQALPGKLRSERPLRLVLDRRPFL